MKKIFNLMFLFVSLLTFSSCYDTMDDKEVIDARYAVDVAPTLSPLTVDTVEAQGFTVQGALSGVKGVRELGLQYSSTESFEEITSVQASKIDTTFSITVDKLQSVSTYYVRAYIFSEGHGFSYSEVVAITTPADQTKWDKASDTGYFFDPFMTSVFNVDQIPMAVEYEISETADNIRYRFNSPYAYTATGQDDKGYGYIGYPYNKDTQVDKQEHKVIIQVSKADGKATMEPFVLGNNWSYGWFEGGSAAGKFGQFANDVITFPEGSLYFFLPEYKGGYQVEAKAGAFYLNAAALEATAGQ